MKAKSYPEVRICIEHPDDSNIYLTVISNDEGCWAVYSNGESLCNIGYRRLFGLLKDNVNDE